jgi:hypothetical protein
MLPSLPFWHSRVLVLFDFFQYREVDPDSASTSLVVWCGHWLLSIFTVDFLKLDTAALDTYTASYRSYLKYLAATQYSAAPSRRQRCSTARFESLRHLNKLQPPAGVSRLRTGHHTFMWMAIKTCRDYASGPSIEGSYHATAPQCCEEGVYGANFVGAYCGLTAFISVFLTIAPPYEQCGRAPAPSRRSAGQGPEYNSLMHEN